MILFDSFGPRRRREELGGDGVAVVLQLSVPHPVVSSHTIEWVFDFPG